jgi:hypothetical protein
VLKHAPFRIKIIQKQIYFIYAAAFDDFRFLQALLAARERLREIDLRRAQAFLADSERLLLLADLLLRDLLFLETLRWDLVRFERRLIDFLERLATLDLLLRDRETRDFLERLDLLLRERDRERRTFHPFFAAAERLFRP